MEIRKSTRPALTSTSELANFDGDSCDFSAAQRMEYSSIKQCGEEVPGNLSPFNNSCERALGLATCVNT